MQGKPLKGYQGIFLSEETKEKLVKLQKKGLKDIVKDMHITFKFGKTEKYPPELMGKEFKMKVVGYASDGKNSGFQIELPDELKKYYKNPNCPHITVSLGEVNGVKGKAVDTGTMKFEPIDEKEQIEIPGQIGYFIYGKGRVMDNKVFDEKRKEEDSAELNNHNADNYSINSQLKNNQEESNQETNVIDITKLGEEIGMEAKEQTLPNGKKVKSLVWDKENLIKAVNATKQLSTEGKPVEITGPAPAWLVSALTHNVHPCKTSIYVPQIGKSVEIPQLPHGAPNPEGELGFKVTEKGDSVLVEYAMELPDGITTYDENNLSKIVVPDIPQGKAVYLSGRGPNYIAVAVAEAYAHTNSSVSLFQPGVGYTCSITHCRNKRLGDLIKDPLAKEEIKENLIENKEKSQNKLNERQ